MNIKIGKSGRKFKYESSFRRKVVEELLSGQISRVELARKYNIPHASTISLWLKHYQAEQINFLPSHNMEDPQDILPAINDKPSKEFERELQLAKIKIATLEAMIDIAEKQFNIEIRKKSGTKPSNE